MLPLTHFIPVDPEVVATIVYFDSSINVARVDASLAIKLVALVPIVSLERVAAHASEDDVGVAGEGVDVNRTVQRHLETSHDSLFTDTEGTHIVEPRGVEPLTSAVQSQIQNVVVVRRCSKTPANKHIISSRLSCLFAVVRVGWCTTGVNELRRNTETFACL